MRKRVNIKMKKINDKGFTLIELLAVITIMGILMMVAIPAVSRIIENSRRDSFVNISKEYINTVRNAVLADNIKCDVGGKKTIVSAVPDGAYYFSIDTLNSQETADLMEQGGKSPFGNAEMLGYVKWVKYTIPSGDGTISKTEYSIALTDSGKHGIETEAQESDLSRSTVAMNVANQAPTTAPAYSKDGATITPVKCELS